MFPDMVAPVDYTDFGREALRASGLRVPPSPMLRTGAAPRRSPSFCTCPDAHSCPEATPPWQEKPLASGARHLHAGDLQLTALPPESPFSLSHSHGAAWDPGGGERDALVTPRGTS